jgi:hypothetical protein
VAGKKGSKRRTPAEVAAVREAAREELAAHHPMTLRQVHYRQVHYRLVSREDIVHPNTQSAYQTLSWWLRDDRLAGHIPWEWMEDRMRVARDWKGWADPAEFLADVLKDYYRDPWQDAEQDHYVEAWLEKDALSGIFLDTLGYYRVVLNVGRGYDGWTSIKRAADRYNYWHSKRGAETTVLYFGDFDPSGEDMHRSLIERLGDLGAHPEVIKVALTREDAGRLPGDVTKADDSRAASFVAKYGDLAVELDALPVEELTARIRASVEEHINMDALEESRRLEREQRKEMAELAERLADEDN